MGTEGLGPETDGVEAAQAAAGTDREARLQLADRLTTLGTLAAAIGHEINNPLTYVIGNLAYVLDVLASPAHERPTEDELVTAVSDALGGAERIALIVKDMRSLGGQGAVRVEPVDLESAIELAIRQTTNHIRHRAKLTRRYTEVPLVDADIPRICQVFVNLLLNAAQAIPQGETRRNEIAVELRTENDEVIVEVTDTGSGIPPDALSRVFEPFFTTKPVGEGTGLGLAICRSIVRSFGGEMEIASTLHVGTTMRVRLPVSKHGQRRETVTAEQPVVPKRERRASVLVVDDDAGVLGAARRLLERHYYVETLADARNVLPHLEQGIRFDVILCDLMMPDMTGMDLHREIAARSELIADRVLFITGGAFTPEARAFLDARGSAHVMKPFEYNQLIGAVEKILNGSPDRPPSLPPITIANHFGEATELVLRFPKEWHHIDVVRESCGFFARAAYRNVLVGQRIEIVVHELVENAIKYATPDQAHVEVDLHGGSTEFEVGVSSRSSREHVGTLLDVLAEIQRTDPADVYLAAMRKYANSDLAGGIGLARVAHEARVHLSADFTRGSMRLVARGVP